MEIKNEISQAQYDLLINTLKARFTKNMKRHSNIEWDKVKIIGSIFGKIMVSI